MRERALRLGKAGNLIGILAEPVAHTTVTETIPAVVLLNSGILHRPGASRLYVQIARKLAREGFTSIRFDFSGIGDSESRRDSIPFATAAVAETREVMDYLTESRGFSRFVLMGLCSGADMAHKVALADERVVGLAELDAWAYRTLSYYARHYGPRLLDASVWRHSIAVRAEGLKCWIARRGADPGRSSAYVSPEYRRRFPPRAQVRDELRLLIERGIHFYYFFTGDQSNHLNAASQYEESFRSLNFCGRIQVEYDATADHTLTSLRHQSLVVDQIRNWMVRNFGIAAPSSTRRNERAATPVAAVAPR